jgi:hypothetical protein
VPAGALTGSVSISIAATSVQPDGGVATTIYRFGPEGQTFAVPATVNLPGTAGVIHWSQVLGGQTVFTEIPTSLAGGLATAKVSHFSYGFLACGWLEDTSASAAYYACPTFTQSGAQVGPVCPPGYSCNNSPTGCFGVPAVGCSGGDVWTGYICSAFCPGLSAVGTDCPIGGLAGVSCDPLPSAPPGDGGTSDAGESGFHDVTTGNLDGDCTREPSYDADCLDSYGGTTVHGWVCPDAEPASGVAPYSDCGEIDGGALVSNIEVIWCCNESGVAE